MLKDCKKRVVVVQSRTKLTKKTMTTKRNCSITRMKMTVKTKKRNTELKMKKRKKMKTMHKKLLMSWPSKRKMSLNATLEMSILTTQG